MVILPVSTGRSGSYAPAEVHPPIATFTHGGRLIMHARYYCLVRTEGCPWNLLERWDLPVLLFCDGSKVALWCSRTRLPAERKRNSQDQKLAARCILTVLDSPKWRSRLRTDERSGSSWFRGPWEVQN